MKTLIATLTILGLMACNSTDERCAKIEDSKWASMMQLGGEGGLVDRVVTTCKEGNLNEDSLECLLSDSMGCTILKKK